MVGNLPGYGKVWYYHLSGIANVLSLSCLREQFQVMFDTRVDNKFMVVEPNGTIFEFTQSDGDLDYLDAGAP